MANADSVALVAAGVRAAIPAKAPRRTVAAVAGAIASVFVRSATEPAGRRRAQPPAGDGATAGEQGTVPGEELVARLREMRAAQRKRKKERRRAGKATACAAAQEVEMDDNDDAARMPASAAGTRGCPAQPAFGAGVCGPQRAHSDTAVQPPPGERPPGPPPEKKAKDDQGSMGVDDDQHQSEWAPSVWSGPSSVWSQPSRQMPNEERRTVGTLDREEGETKRERSRHRGNRQGSGPSDPRRR